MDKNQINHIGVIMDGNRRYVKKHFEELFNGYSKGAKKAEDFVQWCSEENIKEISLYTFSIENAYNRSEIEKKVLEKLFHKTFSNMLSNIKLDEDDVKIRFIGKRSLFEKKLMDIIEKIENKTKNHKKITVNIAFYYSGRCEIIDAFKKMMEDVEKGKLNKEDISEDTIKKYSYLDQSSYPEIILRTGYSNRLSNFLLWHAAYSELYFIDKLWPQIEKQDLIDVINKYKTTKKNFGK